MPKSFVTELVFKSTYSVDENAPTKLIYVITLKDNTKGDFWVVSKEELPAIGEEIEYTSHPNKNPEYLPSIRLSKQKNGFKAFPKNQTAENARIAVASATQLVCANKQKEGKTVLDVAGTLFEWLETKTTK